MNFGILLEKVEIDHKMCFINPKTDPKYFFEKFQKSAPFFKNLKIKFRILNKNSLNNKNFPLFQNLFNFLK